MAKLELELFQPANEKRNRWNDVEGKIKEHK
jgi:hypothetical protein